MTRPCANGCGRQIDPAIVRGRNCWCCARKLWEARKRVRHPVSALRPIGSGVLRFWVGA